MLTLEALLAVVITVGWTLVALLIGWLGGRERRLENGEMPRDTP